MSGTTITTISTSGLTINSASPSPVSIAITGGIRPASGSAIYADASSWSLFNQGNIIGGSTGLGIYIAAGTADLANQGYIGGQAGIAGDITLENTGVIAGRSGAGVTGYGSIVNRGTIVGGLLPLAGNSSAVAVAFSTGTLINGIIGLLRGQYEGANFSGAADISNLGTIQGLAGAGVVLQAGGYVANGSTSDTTALIYGNFGGVTLNGAGTMVNDGRIVSASGVGPRNGVGLDGDGVIINAGQISGFNGIAAGVGSVQNTGAIIGGAALQLAIPFAGYTYVAGAGVVLGGGTLNNAGLVRGGDIPVFPVVHSGTAGAGVTLDGGVVVNTGSIAGGTAAGYNLTGGSGVLAVAGTVVNESLLSGGGAYTGGTGLTILLGAEATNISTGTIQGGAGTFGGAGVLLTGGTLQNAGSIAGGDGNNWNFSPGLAAGVDLYTGRLINAGIITGGAEQRIGVDLGAGSLQNTGTIAGSTGILAQSGYIDNTGLIQGVAVGVDIGSGTLLNAGTISGLYAVYMSSAAQHLVVDPGAAFFGKVVAKGATTSLDLGAGVGTLDMGASFSGLSTIAFDTGGTWDLAGGTAQLAGGEILSGFALGDTLELEGFTANSVQYVAGAGLELFNATATATLDIIGSFAADGFVADADANGTRIAICYAQGTRIMTMRGECNVETLQIGDILPTYFAGTKEIKWIGRQSFALSELVQDRTHVPVRIAAGALGENLPRRDLFISPGHSMLVGGILLLAKDLVNGVTITQPEPCAQVEYYLVEFDSHDCLMAEGSWAESFADGPGLRAQFHNIGEFFELFPNYAPPDGISLCAPRLERGVELADALRPIVTRATSKPPGPLRGFIDLIEGRRVEGWAQDLAWPELPQLLEFRDGDRILGEALACQYRADLEDAGIGTGRAHFIFISAVDFSPQALCVVRPSDGAEIKSTHS